MALLGVIADDFTGATDIAGMLVKNGMRTIQTIGVPAEGTIPEDVDAVVVALKTRSIVADAAVAQSLAALKALQAAGCVRFFFKYCSTFDSTDAGNIGPVGDALLDALKARQAIYCPAFPENGRTIFFGHLFVGDVLLSGFASIYFEMVKQERSTRRAICTSAQKRSPRRSSTLLRRPSLEQPDTSFLKC